MRWLKFEFLKKYLKDLPLGLILPLGAFLYAIYLFTDIAHDIIWKQEVKTDYAFFEFLSLYIVQPWLTAFMKVFTYAGSAPVLQVGYLTLIILYLVKKNYKRTIEITLIAITGTLINLVMKHSFHRLRPPDPLIAPLQSFSFPSGHATAGFIFYGLLAYLVWKTHWPKKYKILIGSVCILFSLAIGFSRVYLRVHFASDVAAGFACGFAWILLAIWIMEKTTKQAKQEVKEEVGVTPPVQDTE